MSEDSIVATERDYQRVYLRDDAVCKTFRQSLSLLFTGNRVLFIGVGMQEGDVCREMYGLRLRHLNLPILAATACRSVPRFRAGQSDRTTFSIERTDQLTKAAGLSGQEVWTGSSSAFHRVRRVAGVARDHRPPGIGTDATRIWRGDLRRRHRLQTRRLERQSPHRHVDGAHQRRVGRGPERDENGTGHQPLTPTPRASLYRFNSSTRIFATIERLDFFDPCSRRGAR